MGLIQDIRRGFKERKVLRHLDADMAEQYVNDPDVQIEFIVKNAHNENAPHGVNSREELDR